MLSRSSFAKLLASVPSEVKSVVFSIKYQYFALRDQSLDRVWRGCGNAAKRRQGVDTGIEFSCSCEWSPCQHEYIWENQSDRREQHRQRRGMKTRRK